MSTVRSLARTAAFLGSVVILVAGAVLLCCASVGCGTAKFDEFDNSNLPVTPVEELHTTGVAPEVNIEDYRLVVDGLVETSLSLPYEAILAYPTVTEVVLLICPGFFTDNAEWTGVPVTTLLAEAGVKPEASRATFHALGTEYQVVLPLNLVQQDGVFLAHTVNGQVLPAEHGYPLRLVVRGNYGHDWVKWVTRIEVV
jgi:DMSO/TMAO reductase YedYZ molybdopterin-dependent catalytic subunit